MAEQRSWLPKPEALTGSIAEEKGLLTATPSSKPALLSMVMHNSGRWSYTNNALEFAKETIWRLCSEGRLSLWSSCSPEGGKNKGEHPQFLLRALFTLAPERETVTYPTGSLEEETENAQWTVLWRKVHWSASPVIGSEPLARFGQQIVSTGDRCHV